jgi:hypothetical protein
LLWQFLATVVILAGCQGEDLTPNRSNSESGETNAVAKSPLQIDSATGIPIATSFGYPFVGASESDFGFCFGGTNGSFPGEAHLGCDTLIEKTPYGKVVVAPADGVVRITTDLADSSGVIGFGAYGSDNQNNPKYKGCLIVLEHAVQGGSQFVTDLIGHVQCESTSSYDVDLKRGNPPRGTIVRKGQYIGHVNHYWHGSGTSSDWHHIHFGIRRGRFSSPSYTRNSTLLSYVRGYAARSAFTYDTTTKRYRHKTWLDPIEFVEGHSDPATSPQPIVRHPSGSILIDPSGAYWQVVSDTEIASIPKAVFTADRYDPSGAVAVSADEIACYTKKSAIESLGPWTIYRRPFTSTVAIAYDKRGERFYFIRWEAFTSWGFAESDIQGNPISNGLTAEYYESFYNPEGYRLLRPGTLVKGDAESEVAIVSIKQTRIPIASGDVFERLGFNWSRVVTIPQSVLDQVAGSRESSLFSQEKMTTCAVPPPCPGGGVCGGGGEAEPPESGDLEPLLDGEDVSSGDAIPITSTASGGQPSVSSDVGGSISFTTGGASATVQAVCTPGLQISCSCGSLNGVQVCANDGQSFDVCQCSAASSGGASSISTGGASSTGGSLAIISTGGTISVVNPTGGATPVTTCMAGALYVCPCSSGSGTAICNANGLGFSACSCPTAVAVSVISPTTGGSISTGGSPPVQVISTGGVAPMQIISTGGMTYAQVISTGGAPTVSPSTGGMATISTGGAKSVTGGSPPTGGAPTQPIATSSPLHLSYTSPLCGLLHVEAWWKRADGTNRSWGTIAECVDTNPSDCSLDCDLPIAAGTPYFEFQVTLPNGEGYGNEDCYNGGCGQPLGTLHLYRGSTEIPFSLTPNPAGAPYYNEVLQPVP